MRILYRPRINLGPQPCEEGYGLLYNWYATTDARKISSSDDWIVPTSTDYNTLVTYLGGSSVAGNKLREVDADYWNTIINNTNESGFNARGGGDRKRITGAFESIKSQGFYGASDVFGGAYIYMLQLPDNGSALVTSGVGTEGHKISGLSVRLLYTGAGTPTSYTDNSGNVYRVVTIGTQTWLADNLRDVRFRNGDIIPYHGVDNDSTFTNAEWAALTTAGVCAYNNDVANVGCDFSFPTESFINIKYGALYNWYSATEARNITSSDDWIVPNESQYITLTNYVGGESIAGLHLKYNGFWNSGGLNTYGFNLKSNGERDGYGGEFLDGLGVTAKLWTTSTYSIYAKELYVEDPSDFATIGLFSNKQNGFAIRLLYIGVGTPTSYTGNDGKVYNVVTIGTQTWLADNLFETKYRNGDWITGYDGGVYTPISDANWDVLTTEAMCIYEDDESNAVN